MQVKVPAKVEVCGGERVQRKHKVDKVLNFELTIYSKQFTIDELALSFENEADTGCLINRYELWTDPTLPIN